MGTVTEGKALSKRKPILRGTEGSNPAPSSGEAIANPTFAGASHRISHARNKAADRLRRALDHFGSFLLRHLCLAIG